MDYGALLSRAFHIAWRHRFLWLLALFAGEASAGSGFSARFPAPGFEGSSRPSAPPAAPGAPTPPPNLQPAVDWIVAHIGLLAEAAAAVVVLAIVLFVISCYAVSAVVRAVEALDEGEEVGLGRAWRLGSERVVGVLRLRLLLLAFALLIVLVVVALAGLVAVSALHKLWVGVAVGVYVTASGLMLLFPLGLVLPPVLRLATRAIVLERAGAWAGLRKGARLLVRRPGPVVIMYAVEIGASLVLALVALVVVAVLALPVASVALFTHEVAGAVISAVLLGLLVTGVLVVAGAAVAAYLSTVWTLGYRRIAGA